MKLIAFSVAIVLALLLLAVLVDVGLQSLFGFGHPPLYQADDAIGYLLAPNQRLRRLGNRIEINRYAMRTGPIQPERPASTLRIMLLGDSIVNGNWWTDQAETLSARLEGAIAQQLDQPPFNAYTAVEVLNVSANSWGPRNQLAYLQRFGSFDAQMVVLVLNTDDLFATAPTSLQVGQDPSYPDRAPGSALLELLQRRRQQGRSVPGLKAVQNEPGDRVGKNLSAVRDIHRLVKQTQAQTLLVLTPLKREVLPPGPRDYEAKARQRVAALVSELAMPYLDFLGPFQQAETEGLYRDHIHLSPAGNVLVQEAVLELVTQQLKALADGNS